MLINSFIIVQLLSCYLLININSENLPVTYLVPEPQIDAYANGFRVKIPDENGISLFAFHGNINRPLADLEAGSYSKDILTKTDGYWIFEDMKTKLKVGDKIYYWLFVIKYGLGYRYDHGEFTVKEIIPANIHSTSLQLNNISITFPNDRHELLETSTCCQLYLNSSKTSIEQQQIINNLIEENSLLYEIAGKQQLTENVFLKGRFPNFLNSSTEIKEFVQNFLLEKLEIRNIGVLDAKLRSPELIVFTINGIRNKVKIIKLANEKLKFSTYKIDIFA